MPNFRQADQEAFDLIESIISTTYPDLEECKLTYAVLFAYPNQGVGPALKHHGYTAAAIIKITSHADRVAGLPDVTIRVDGNKWETLDDEGRAALLDHELNHLIVKRDKEGCIEEDDQGRPLLKMRLHDAQLGVFYAVINRYGPTCIDAQVCQALYSDLTQREFDWEGTARPTVAVG